MIRYVKYLALVGLINGLVYAKKPSPSIPEPVQHATTNATHEVNEIALDAFAGMVAIAVEVTQKKNIPFDIDPIDLSFDLSPDDIEALKAQLIDILKQLQTHQS